MDELTPDELKEALLELRRTYGTGLAPLRCGASVNLEGRYFEARPLADLPADANAVVRCLFCSRDFASEVAMRTAHKDVHGMRARAEQHVHCVIDQSSGQIYTGGAPMGDP